MNIPTHRSVKSIMACVLLALTPGIAVFLTLTGWGGLITFIIAISTALLTEAAAFKLRRQSIKNGLTDYSAIVTAVLLSLCLPPLLPWWIVVMATFFAIMLAKHAYGGLGQNLFNPAMAGYALVLISFPLDLSSWIIQPEAFNLSLYNSLKFVFTGGLSQAHNYDALTGATALSQLYDLKLQNTPAAQIIANVSGTFGARYSEWLNLAFLFGGIMLIAKQVITWHLPAALLGGVTVSYLLVGFFHSDPYTTLPFHLFSGATMLCAFFIITDPVTAPASNRARMMFGFFTGILLILIRRYGAYPDSAAFAVLLMNCCVPMLDRLDTALQAPQ